MAYSAEVLIAHVRWAMENAHGLKSKLTDQIMMLQGMSGVKTRHFYNNIGSLRGAKYLEIGTWQGSSLISTLYGNEKTIDATVIDNWSQFGGPKQAFLDNVHTIFGGIPSCLEVVDADCFGSEPTYRDIDIYLYDGGHSTEDHRRSITHYWKCLSDRAIIIVDDWNWPEVHHGTWQGLRDVDAKILYHTEVRHIMIDGHTPSPTCNLEFWNGIGVFVIEKSTI